MDNASSLYLSEEVIFLAFDRLGEVLNSGLLSEGQPAKKGIEKTSAIRYLLATSMVLQDRHNKGIADTWLPLDPISHGEVRKDFVQAVGKFVSIDASGLFTKNFSNAFEVDSSYGVSNNFLTSVLKRTRGRDEIEFYPSPSRNAPLLQMRNEHLSPVPNLLESLLSAFDIDKIRAALALWFCRNLEIAEIRHRESSVLQREIARLLEMHLTSDVATEFTPSSEELDLLLVELGDEEWFSSVKVECSKLYVAVAPEPAEPDIETAQVESTDDGITSEHVSLAIRLVEKGANAILLSGPPGTGKTWIADKVAMLLADNVRERVEYVQFHPSFGYEDFLEGVTSTGSLSTTAPLFAPKKKLFALFCDLAAAEPESRFIFVIDEITRGDSARILGEILTYIEADKRGKLFKLPYSGADFSVPENIVVIGTMNSSDRSVTMMDQALLRRFKTIDVGPDYKLLKEILHQKTDDAGFAGQVAALFNEINSHVGKVVGHALFFNLQPNSESLEYEWRYGILPYLRTFDLPHELLSDFEQKLFSTVSNSKIV